MATDSPRYQPYPAYRDSGVDWLGEIPTHWNVQRLRFAALINPRTSEFKHLPLDTEVSFLPMERIGEDGLLDLGETRPIQALAGGYTSFKDGDVLIAKITPCYENGKGALCAALTGGIGFGTTELHVLRTTTDLDPKFLFYLTRASDFRAIGAAMMDGAAGQKRVPQSFLENIAIGIPPLSEQRSIAAFLDRETARLDALIAKKERLLALLAEKRATLDQPRGDEGSRSERADARFGGRVVGRDSGALGNRTAASSHRQVCGLPGSNTGKDASRHPADNRTQYQEWTDRLRSFRGVHPRRGLCFLDGTRFA